MQGSKKLSILIPVNYLLLAEGCMSKCGGGAAINMGGKIFKARDMEKAVNILFQEQLSVTTL